MFVPFKKDTPFGEIVLMWWEGLEEDRASRAILRRAFSVTAVAMTPAYQRLYRRLCAAGWKDKAGVYHNDRLAAAIGLLAHVEKNIPEMKPVQAMSVGDEDMERPPVSELRFMRLLDAPDIDSLFTGMRRVLPLMKKGVDVLALIQDIVNWNDDIKKQWAYGYKWPEKSAS
jgi:CRISPR system Cascade subunit CasB